QANRKRCSERRSAGLSGNPKPEGGESSKGLDFSGLGEGGRIHERPALGLAMIASARPLEPEAGTVFPRRPGGVVGRSPEDLLVPTGGCRDVTGWLSAPERLAGAVRTRVLTPRRAPLRGTRPAAYPGRGRSGSTC